MKITLLIRSRALVARLRRKTLVAINFCGPSLVLMSSFIFLTACKREVLHDLSELQANTIVARLHTVDVEAQKTRQTDGNWSILVQEEQFQEALLFLTRARLLQNAPTTSEDLEGGLFPKNSRGTLSYQKGLGAEIRETLRSLPGVLDAKVHLYLPKQESLFERHQSSRGTGSVLLIVSTEAHIVNEEVAQLVAGAAGLQHQDVSVLQTVETNPGLVAQRNESAGQVEDFHLHKDRLSLSLDRVIAYLPSKPLLSLAAFILIFVGSFLIFRSYRSLTYSRLPQAASGD